MESQPSPDKTQEQSSTGNQNSQENQDLESVEKQQPTPTPTSTPAQPSNSNSNAKSSGKVELGKKKRTFKIIVIGDTGVGKTCLTYRFCSGKFPSTPTDATIGVDFREKMITIDNKEQVFLVAME